MSGGSYDYLFTRDAAQLFEADHNLEAMAARLAGLGYAKDAAREAEELLLIVRQTRVRIQTRIDRLSALFKAIEWWDSCDSGEEIVREALMRYRESGAL